MVLRSSDTYRKVVALIFLATVLAAVSGCGKETTFAEHFAKAQQLRADGNYPAAMAELDNALVQDPKDLHALLLAAQLSIDIEAGDAALGILRRATEEGAAELDVLKLRTRASLLAHHYDDVITVTADIPEQLSAADKASLLADRGAAFLALKKIDEARIVLRDASTLDPNSIDVLSSSIRLDFAAGNLSAANEMVAQAVKQAPESMTIQQLEGDLALQAKDHAKAEEIFKKLSTHAPWNITALASLAMAQIGGEKYSDAISTLNLGPEDEAEDTSDTSIQLPKYPILKYVRAVATYQLSDFKNAQKFAEQVVLADARFAPARLIAGMASYQLREYERARYHLAFYVAEVPANSQARQFLASTLIILNAPDKAVETLQPVLQRPDASAELLALGGVAAQRSGDAATARRYLAEAVQKRPNDTKMRAELGTTELALGDAAASLEQLQRVTETNPDAPELQTLLFVGYLKTKAYDKAVAAAERVQSLRPTDPLGFNMAAAVYLAKGDSQAGREALLKARALAPGDINSNRNLAALAIEQNKLDDARVAYENILKTNPQNSETYIQLSNIERRTGDLRGAEATLERAVKEVPDDPSVVAALIEFRLNTGNLVGALSVGSPALKKYPDDARLLHAVGRVQLRLGQHDAALLTFQHFARLQPHATLAHIDLAEAYLALRTSGHPQWQAITEAQTAVDAAPNDKAANLILARAMIAHDRYQDAGKVVEKLKVEYSKDLSVIRLDGAIAQGQGRFEDAVRIFHDATLLSQDGTDRRLFAEAELKLGRTDEAKKIIKDWIDSHPSDLAMRRTLADLCEQTGQLIEAALQYRKLVTEIPKDWSLRTNLASILLRIGNSDEALIHAREARVLAPGSAEVRDVLGMVLLKKGMTDDALEQLTAAWKEDRERPRIGFHLAEALVASNRKDDAVPLLREVLAGNGTFRERAEAQDLLHQIGG